MNMTANGAIITVVMNEHPSLPGEGQSLRHDVKFAVGSTVIDIRGTGKRWVTQKHSPGTCRMVVHSESRQPTLVQVQMG